MRRGGRMVLTRIPLHGAFFTCEGEGERRLQRNAPCLPTFSLLARTSICSSRKQETHMKTRTLIVGSVAGLSLAGVLLASPSFAQDANNPPQYSSPEEKAKTQRLNTQAVSGTKASPASLNGEPADSNRPSAQPVQDQQTQQQTQGNPKN
jgi:hypothetical protein